MDRNKLNAAQQLRQALGVEVIEAGQFPRNASATKRGPGRRHKDGTKRDTPIQNKTGAFAGQHTVDSARRLRRVTIEKIGRRQYLKRIKALKRAEKQAEAA